MRTVLLALGLFCACGSSDDTATIAGDGGADTSITSDAAFDAIVPDTSISDTSPVDSCPPLPADPSKAMYLAVDPTRLITHLKEGSGVLPITLSGDGGVVSLSNRYSPIAKANFRDWYEQYLTSLGLYWHELPYVTKHNIGEVNGKNVEAVLPGASADSVVVIIHYDSIGPGGQETGNPGADDDLTGVVSMMEAERLFSNGCLTRQKTIRFVIADYEEQLNPGLEGARVYAAWLKAKAAQDGFQIVAAIDYEQSGWNCASDAKCPANVGGKVYDVFDCSGDGNNFKSTALGDSLAALTTGLGSPLMVNRACMAQNSDHYAMWEIGVPSVVTSEHLPFSNPHFDQNGGDTYDKLDTSYHAEIARLSVAFTAKLAGVGQ